VIRFELTTDVIQPAVAAAKGFIAKQRQPTKKMVQT
jgi:hypothetical protein